MISGGSIAKNKKDAFTVNSMKKRSNRIRNYLQCSVIRPELVLALGSGGTEQSHVRMERRRPSLQRQRTDNVVQRHRRCACITQGHAINEGTHRRRSGWAAATPRASCCLKTRFRFTTKTGCEFPLTRTAGEHYSQQPASSSLRG